MLVLLIVIQDEKFFFKIFEKGHKHTEMSVSSFPTGQCQALL